MSSCRTDPSEPFPFIRPLRANDFAKLVLLEQQVDSKELRSSVGPSASAYYLKMCCEHFQETSLIVEEDGEPIGYLLAFIQGREAFCGGFGVVTSDRRSPALMERVVERFIAQVQARVDVLWWTLPMASASKRALLQRLGAVEIEHRADFSKSGPGRVLVRLGIEQLLPGHGTSLLDTRRPGH